MTVGIDASNIGVAGGATHLVEILRHLDPSNHNVGRVVVWGRQGLLDRIESRNWLELSNPSLLERSLLHRLYWQQCQLAEEAEDRCDVLFVPGGLYFGAFRPYVTIMQNLLPFDVEERSRYGMTMARLRLHLLCWGQRKTFESAAGTIFLSRTSQRIFERNNGALEGRTTIIPHGVSERFKSELTADESRDSYTEDDPFRWLYVSPIRLYKHQWNVVRAVGRLRREGYPIVLDLVGHSNPQALKKLRSVCREVDPGEEYIRYRGRVPHCKISDLYQRANAFVSASTCETFGMVLTEAMQAGLPIACSNRSMAPEVVQDAGEYFDPEQPIEIKKAMRKIMENKDLRRERSKIARERADGYSWGRCANETFSFISNTYKECFNQVK